MVYSPPPLDEIWLSEPERHERKQRLRDQRVRNEERLRERAHSIPVDSPKKIKRSPCAPVPQTSDDERSILSDSSSHHRHKEPEGDGWQDHQDLQDPDDVSITSSPPSPLHQAPNPVEKRSLRDDESQERIQDSEGATKPSHQPSQHHCRKIMEPAKWQRDEEGWLTRIPQLNLAAKLDIVRDPGYSLATRAQTIFSLTSSELDRLSPEDKKKYALTIGPTDSPPMAHRLARKRLKYKQRQMRLCQYDDMLMPIKPDDVPTVEGGRAHG